MKFSTGCVPFRVDEALEMAKVAEENGFYGFWFADEIYFHDPWTLMAACAMVTKGIVLGPCVTHVYLRDPTLIAQALGTLDQLSGGRAACAIGFGAPRMLQQYHIELKDTKPVKRLREAVEVIRKMLTEPQVTFNGEYFKYSGLSSTAKKVGKLPIYIGGMKGPYTFRLAGEIGDGIMLAYGYSREYFKYVLDEVEKGAKMARRDLNDFDVADCLVLCVSRDSDIAKQTVKMVLGGLVSMTPDVQLVKHGIQLDAVLKIREALSKGDASKAIDLTTIEMVEKSSICGSPEECIEDIKRLEASGLKHAVTMTLDYEFMQHYSGRKVTDLPTYKEMIKLINKKIMPHFQ